MLAALAVKDPKTAIPIQTAVAAIAATPVACPAASAVWAPTASASAEVRHRQTPTQPTAAAVVVPAAADRAPAVPVALASFPLRVTRNAPNV